MFGVVKYAECKVLDTFSRSYVRICKRCSIVTGANIHHVRNIYSNKLKSINVG